MSDERAAVSFSGWKAALASVALPLAERAHAVRDIIGFLHFCREQHALASIAIARLYLKRVESQVGSGAGSPRCALRWFFRAARVARPPVDFGPSSPGAAAPVTPADPVKVAATGAEREPKWGRASPCVIERPDGVMSA